MTCVFFESHESKSSLESAVHESKSSLESAVHESKSSLESAVHESKSSLESAVHESKSSPKSLFMRLKCDSSRRRLEFPSLIFTDELHSCSYAQTVNRDRFLEMLFCTHSFTSLLRFGSLNALLTLPVEKDCVWKAKPRARRAKPVTLFYWMKA